MMPVPHWYHFHVSPVTNFGWPTQAGSIYTHDQHPEWDPHGTSSQSPCITQDIVHSRAFKTVGGLHLWDLKTQLSGLHKLRWHECGNGRLTRPLNCWAKPTLVLLLHAANGPSDPRLKAYKLAVTWQFWFQWIPASFILVGLYNQMYPVLSAQITERALASLRPSIQFAAVAKNGKHRIQSLTAYHKKGPRLGQLRQAA